MSLNVVNKTDGSLTQVAGTAGTAASRITFDDTSSSLGSSNVQGAIDNLTTIVNTKQASTDNTLTTTAKTVVGAINEVRSGLTNVDVALSVPNGAGKNVLPLTLANLKARNTAGTWSGNVYTCPNVAFTVNTNDDGLVTSISTTSSGSSVDTMALEFKLPKGTYKLTSGFTETSGSTDTLLFKDNVVIARGNSASPGQIFTLASDSTVVWNIRDTSSDIIAYPMIHLASITDDTYAPYIPSVESRIEAVESDVETLNTKNATTTASITISDKLTSESWYPVVVKKRNGFCYLQGVLTVKSGQTISQGETILTINDADFRTNQNTGIAMVVGGTGVYAFAINYNGTVTYQGSWTIESTVAITLNALWDARG